MTVVVLLCSIILPMSVGYGVLRILLGNRYTVNGVVGPAISFGLGMGFLANGMLILTMIGIKLTLVNITLMQLLSLSVFQYINMRQTNIPEPRRSPLLEFPPERSILDEKLIVKILHIVFWLSAGFLAYFAFWRALHIPIYEWDSFATSIYNAKVIYFDGTLERHKFLPYSVYPLQVPLLCVWTSLCVGEWHDQYIKILFPVASVAFVLTYYSFLRYWSGRVWAMLGTLFLLSSNLLVFHATISYRDLFLAYYTCCAMMFVVLWSEKRQWSCLLLASIFIGMATFIKLEGILYMLIHLAVVLYLVVRDKRLNLKKRATDFLIYCLPCIGIFLIYYCYKIFANISTMAYISPNFSGVPDKLGHSVQVFAKALIFTANWNIHWIWLFFSLVFNFSVIKSDKKIQILLLSLILYLGLHFILSLLLGISSYALSQFTISRLILHFFPIVPLLIVLINFQVCRK